MIGSRQRDGYAADAAFTSIEYAVIVGIDIHEAAQTVTADGHVLMQESR